MNVKWRNLLLILACLAAGILGSWFVVWSAQPTVTAPEPARDWEGQARIWRTERAQAGCWATPCYDTELTLCDASNFVWKVRLCGAPPIVDDNTLVRISFRNATDSEGCHRLNWLHVIPEEKKP